jgi:hypothetical protein
MLLRLFLDELDADFTRPGYFITSDEGVKIWGKLWGEILGVLEETTPGLRYSRISR